jgi:galactokinase
MGAFINDRAPEETARILREADARMLAATGIPADARRPRCFWAPGRVNLIGDYTDLAGGLVLPAAINLGISLHALAAARTTLTSAGVAAATGWHRYVDAVEAELALLGRPEVGIEGELHSTLPIGAGLSSSAALEVVVALALCAVADFKLAPLELAQAARRAEHRAVGVPCGILDQAACVLGRADCAILLNTGTLTHELVQLPKRLAIVIVDSGIRRHLEHSRYATRKHELEHGHPQRLRHVHSESERVRATVAALRSDDLESVGELFRASHESLRIDFEVTTPELDRLELAYAHGALAARMTGGGFGGAIAVLADETDAKLPRQRDPRRLRPTRPCLHLPRLRRRARTQLTKPEAVTPPIEDLQPVASS